MDIGQQLGLVRRSVVTKPGDGSVTCVQTLSRAYDTDLPDLWEAVTTPQRIARWFTPVSGDLRLGGRYQCEGNAGGVVEACDPPHAFTATWEYGEEVSRIVVTLSAEGERTRLTLEHTADIATGRWDEFGPGATGVGWELGLLGLDLYLDSGADVAAEAATGWAASDEARRFMAGSSSAWAQASAAAGTPAEQASAAGDRTTAFYTGG